VDVLVEFERPTTFDAHMGLLVFLEDLLGCRVDVVTAKGLKPRLRLSSIRIPCVSRDPMLYEADIVTAGCIVDLQPADLHVRLLPIESEIPRNASPYNQAR
jgi:hypothetical protein